MDQAEIRKLFGKAPVEQKKPDPAPEPSLFAPDDVNAPWTAWIRLKNCPWKVVCRCDSYDEAWRQLLKEHPAAFCEKIVQRTGKHPRED